MMPRIGESLQAQALIVLFWGRDRPGEIPHLGRLG
jgi:hypothetical protein